MFTFCLFLLIVHTWVIFDNKEIVHLWQMSTMKELFSKLSWYRWHHMYFCTFYVYICVYLCIVVILNIALSRLPLGTHPNHLASSARAALMRKWLRFLIHTKWGLIHSLSFLFLKLKLSQPFAIGQHHSLILYRAKPSELCFYIESQTFVKTLAAE